MNQPPLMSPGTFLAIWFATLFGTIAVALIVWRVERRPLFKPRFPDRELEESWCSGMSTSGLMGAMGWANNCLWIVLARDTLHAGVHFPFSLFLPRFLIGFDVHIPVSAIRAVDKETSFLKGTRLKVTYERPGSLPGVVRTERLELRPRGDRLFEELRARVAERSTTRATR